ncbi:MAG: hypothetical protein PsegKO_32990 [Pseudohongiellaceae bacterium]
MSDDLQTLFPAREVAGLSISPWTLDQHIRVGPLIEALLDRASELGLKLDADLLKALEDESDEALAEQLKQAPALIRLILRSLPDVKQLILLTVGEDQGEAVGQLRGGQTTEVVVAIIMANWEDLKGFFAGLEDARSKLSRASAG